MGNVPTFTPFYYGFPKKILTSHHWKIIQPAIFVTFDSCSYFGHCLEQQKIAKYFQGNKFTKLSSSNHGFSSVASTSPWEQALYWEFSVNVCLLVRWDVMLKSFSLKRTASPSEIREKCERFFFFQNWSKYDPNFPWDLLHSALA